MQTTIIIPALNEGAVIAKVVCALKMNASLLNAGITDIVVIDNGSDDDTAVQARLAGARVISEPQRGYGRACLAGIMASPDADIIIQMDGDGSDVPDDIVRVWRPVAEGRADLAVGSRAQGNAEAGALTPQQIVGNAVGALVLRAAYGVQVTDIGPLRAFRRDVVVRQMAMGELTYGWSVEMLAKAGRLGLRVVEVPVSYRRRAGGESKVAGTVRGTLKASWRILSTLARLTRWHPQPSRSVLFIMARLPIPGHTKTRLGNVIGHDQAANLYAAFLDDLGERFSAASRRDGYDLCWFFTQPDNAEAAAFQRYVPVGDQLLRQDDSLEFGERLWQGFDALYRQGYERIIVLGSDSPHISASLIGDAFAALETHDMVIGPAHDGGYFLLGQRGAPTDVFSGITMSTSAVYAQTITQISATGRSLAYLPVMHDIDEPADLAPLHAFLRSAPDASPATLAALESLVLPSPIAEGSVHAE